MPMERLTAGAELAGRFRLIRVVGRGALGEVWLAEDLASGGSVALKFPASESAAAVLRDGFAAAARLVHPAIVGVHEYIAQPPPALVMQFVEGGDAGTLRGAGFRDILRALLPVAEALEYAHRQGVVHRDLKPANILRDRQGRLLLADFGAAAGGGTLPAMSPQQLDGAPPAASDDVYAFGALLCELLAGVPLFHPEVTPERIRTALPEIPRTDLGGEPLPLSLRRLLGALIEKSPELRPPGMGAVRDALEQILRDAEARTPVQDAAAVIEPRAREAVPAPAAVSHAGVPARRVWIALVLLIGLAAGVVLYLPRLVRERGAAVTTPAVPALAPPAVTPEQPAAMPQRELDEALGEFLRLDDELRKRGAERWAGEEWTRLRGLAEAGDGAYRRRAGGEALEAYRAAGALAKQLLARAPAVLEAALQAGRAALAAGDEAAARARFETVLAIDAAHPEARRGLERAKHLPQLRALLAQASAAEQAGERQAALGFYRQAVALDADAAAAREGVARLQKHLAADAYAALMARGHAAQARGDHEAAGTAFSAALRQRPGDTAAQSALAQVRADQQLARLMELHEQAVAFEKEERWSDALSRWESALALDAALASAKEGAARARTRLDLDQRMRSAIASAERFNDDVVLADARATLAAARTVPDAGPGLAARIEELARLLELAVIPVKVRVDSDNLTEVTIYKVGRLGRFDSRSLELRPGLYTVVGSRAGYRDVRRTVRVQAGGDGMVVSVRCEETI